MSQKRTANEQIVDIFMAAEPAKAEELLDLARRITRNKRPTTARRARKSTPAKPQADQSATAN